MYINHLFNGEANSLGQYQFFPCACGKLSVRDQLKAGMLSTCSSRFIPNLLVVSTIMTDIVANLLKIRRSYPYRYLRRSSTYFISSFLWWMLTLSLGGRFNKYNQAPTSFLRNTLLVWRFVLLIYTLLLSRHGFQRLWSKRFWYLFTLLFETKIAFEMIENGLQIYCKVLFN